MWTVHAVRNNDSQLAGNPCKKNICLRSGMVPGFPPGDTHVSLEMVDSPLHGRPYLIEGNPFIGIPLDTGKHAEVHVFVSIGGTPFFSGAAGILTIAHPLPFYYVDFRADPFVTVRTPFLVAMPGVFHVQCAVFWAGGIAVRVIADFFKGTIVSRVVRDQYPGKMEFIPEEAVSFDRVKSGITQKSIRMEMRVERKEIREDRFQGRRITDGFIIIGGTGFLFHGHFRMCSFKSIIEKGDMADNAEAVSKDGEFISIAEMAIDVLLFCVRTGGSLWRHEAVSHLIRVNIRIIFIVSLEASDKGIKGFGIVFGDIKLNA